MDERLWPRVQKTESCWLWQGHQGKSGHGTIGRGGKGTGHMLVHRLSWELANGPVPQGVCVLHKCDVPNCVRPDHLFLGTRTDNARDKTEKGRTRKGETHQTAKLTEAQVYEIRRRWANRTLVSKRVPRGDPDSITNVAKDYGISITTLHEIVHRKIWKHLTD